MSKVTTELDYDDGMSKLPEGVFKISPSSFSRFMDRPHEWYREQVLGEGTFMGNTATVIGTLVHYVAEKVAKKEAVNHEEIAKYLSTFSDNEDVDLDEVKTAYKPMAEKLVNDYILKNMPEIAEDFVALDFGDGVWIAGSVDAFDNGCVIDYKTYNSKTKPRSIPMGYRYQLLTYAYVYHRLGYEVDRIRLVYVNKSIDGGISEKTGKPLKSYPPEVTVLTETIGKDDFEFIESVLTLCKETYLKAKEDPSLVHLLYRDMRLKNLNLTERR
jgi:hypothetical protein